MTKDELFAQGMAKVKENDHQGAIDLFTKVLELDPTDANSLSHRGIAYLNLNQLELAMIDMNSAVEHDPEYSFRYQSRGYLKAHIKDYKGALADYQKAVDLDPNDAIALNNLALAQEQMGWAEQAKTNFDKSDKIQGIKTATERSKERLKRAEEANARTKDTTEENSSKSDIAKSVFTKKSSFKEFLRFIGNGFKLKEDDKS